jgi:V8-like Glu-specific endopeptidase
MTTSTTVSGGPFKGVGMRGITFILVLAVMLVSQSGARAAFTEPKLVADPYPFIARVISIEAGGVERHCSGTMVSRWHVLTAAHCVDQGGRPTVETSRGERIAVTHTIVSAGWSQPDNRYAYDHALLRLAAPVEDWRPLELWSPVYLFDRFWSAGYPVRSTDMYLWSGSLDSAGNGVTYQGQAGYPGMSGSPLMHGDKVIGVHSHRLGGATGYSLVQQELVAMLSEDLRALSSPGVQAPVKLFLPLAIR